MAGGWSCPGRKIRANRGTEMKSAIRRIAHDRGGIAAFAIASLLAAGPAAATEGYFALGYGPNQRALAGAGAAHPFEAMSATLNPASVAHVGRETQYGVELFMPFRGYTGTGTAFVPSGEVESNNNLFIVPNFAYNTRLDGGAALNFTIYGNGGMNTSYPTGLAGCGSVYCSGKAGVDLMQIFFAVSYAREMGDFTIGISPTLVAQRFSARGLGAFAGISSNPAALTNNGYDWSYGGGVKAGLQWQASERLRFGLAGQTKMQMSKFEKYAGLFEDGGAFDIPASITAGIAWKASPDTTIMLDYQKIFYSDVPAIGNAGNAGALGAPGGAGFGWDDVDVVKLAVEWKAGDRMTWRAGYAHASNPVGPEDVTLNIIAPGIVEHHLALGGSWKLDSGSSFDFAVNYVPESTVSGTETTPGGPTPGSVVKLNMHQFSISFGFTKRF